MSWRPTEVDIVWSENLIRVMKQGAVWSTTDGQSMYKFDHENKKLITIKNNNAGLHSRIQIIFRKLGWSVDDNAASLDPERN